MLPTPHDLGLPPHIDKWRSNQEQAIEDGGKSTKRFLAQAVPTGGGKSASNLAQSLLAGSGKTVYLTHTKGLQDQLLGEFGDSLGMVDIRGRGNYRCRQFPDRTCDQGKAAKCSCAGTVVCPADAAYKLACESRYVVTNYQWWIANGKAGRGLGQVDRLILDEGHSAPEELASALQVRLSSNEINEILGHDWPLVTNDLGIWRRWAVKIRRAAETHCARLSEYIRVTPKPKHRYVEEYQHMLNLRKRLSMLYTMTPEHWVVEEWEHGYQFDPIQVGRYAESYLFRGVGKIHLTSATLRPKTLWLLGVGKDQYDFQDYPSIFPPSRSPIYHVPGVRLNYETNGEMLGIVWARMNQIIGKRLDRKGIIHSVSYKRKEEIIWHSAYRKHMLHNRRGDVTSELVRSFKAHRAPAILVSPSVMTGYNFPYRDSEYQILAKIPWPNPHTVLNKARSEADPEYLAYVTALSIVQAFGRGFRAPDDQQEGFILDDGIQYFMGRYSYLFPKWFIEMYRDVKKVPEPMEAL